ncbi:MAG: HD domain-containing protein [Ruminococcus sp.]|nr:HD domain-containing protein [Ruminococcus sp.]
MELKRTDIKIPEYAQKALRMLEAAGFECWCVGGCVRDSLRKRQVHDWDICTSAYPEQMLEVFSSLHTIKTGIKHGTITVRIDHQSLEITTYRTDGEYLDHRRPEAVEFVGDIRADLERRDFTMNAICLSLRQEIYDPFDGQGDIERGIIRCVGDPRRRFDEDALRILRAVRFAAKTGYTVEEQTKAAAIEMKGLLDSVSVERIYSELKSMLTQPYIVDALIEYAPIIMQIIPEAAPCVGFKQNNPHHCYDVWEHIARSVGYCREDALLRTVMLLHDIGKPDMFYEDEDGVSHFKRHQIRSAEYADDILRRLKSDVYSRKRIVALVSEHDNRIAVARKSVRRMIARYDYDFFMDYLEVRRADTLAQSEYKRAQKLSELDELARIAIELKEEDACFKLRDLAVGGSEMMELGLVGSEIGKMLRLLFDEVVAESLPNEREALITAAKERMKNEL